MLIFYGQLDLVQQLLQKGKLSCYKSRAEILRVSCTRFSDANEDFCSSSTCHSLLLPGGGPCLEAVAILQQLAGRYCHSTRWGFMILLFHHDFCFFHAERVPCFLSSLCEGTILFEASAQECCIYIPWGSFEHASECVTCIPVGQCGPHIEQRNWN